MVLTTLLLAALATAPAAAQAQSGLDGALQCPCDCGKFLTTCDCDSADEARGFVSDLKSRGQGDAEVAESYGERYGEQYVNYVPKSGRGLSLWLAAPVGVVVGAGAIYYRLQGTGDSAVGGTTGAGCPNCGAGLGPDAKFCTECGAEAGLTTCSGCGASVRDDNAFCTGCGEPLESSCPSCGSSADPGAKFCSGCGEEL